MPKAETAASVSLLEFTPSVICTVTVSQSSISSSKPVGDLNQWTPLMEMRIWRCFLRWKSERVIDSVRGQTKSEFVDRYGRESSF